jgi:hypothetical protein
LPSGTPRGAAGLGAAGLGAAAALVGGFGAALVFPAVGVGSTAAVVVVVVAPVPAAEPQAAVNKPSPNKVVPTPMTTTRRSSSARSMTFSSDVMFLCASSTFGIEATFLAAYKDASTVEAAAQCYELPRAGDCRSCRP